MQTKVSMVMPVYNKKDDIAVMLESVYNQVWDNIELIMVNDGSSDGTRDVIEDWVPRFHYRGYSVIIIDQENQGISAAVRNGMLKMTGDYFCSVDCDDYLYPEYVSAMASCLDESPEFDYTACGYEKIYGTNDKQTIVEADMDTHGRLFSEKRAENMLLHRLPLISWFYLVRVAYLNKCMIIENFVTEPPLHQEPSISLPLSMGNGHIKYVPRVLYRHSLLGRQENMVEIEGVIPNYAENYTQILRMAIMKFDTNDERWKNKLFHICEFFRLKLIYNRSGGCGGHHEQRIELAKKVADFANRYFRPSPNVVAEAVLFTGFEAIFCMIEDCILETRRPPIKQVLEPVVNGRVICYGALGKTAKQLIPPLFETNLKPDVLWDLAANGERINDISVKAPDFSDLTPDDIAIIVPINSSVRAQAGPYLAKAGVKHIVSHNELVQYLGQCHYPSFAKDCRFAPS